MGSRDTGYLPFYFQGYRNDTFHFTSREMGYYVQFQGYCYVSSKIYKYREEIPITPIKSFQVFH